jgi:hypothetical protein
MLTATTFHGLVILGMERLAMWPIIGPPSFIGIGPGSSGGPPPASRGLRRRCGNGAGAGPYASVRASPLETGSDRVRGVAERRRSLGVIVGVRNSETSVCCLQIDGLMFRSPEPILGFEPRTCCLRNRESGCRDKQSHGCQVVLSESDSFQDQLGGLQHV